MTVKTHFLKFVFAAITSLALLLIVGTNIWVLLGAKGQLHTAIENMQSADVALVFGTSRSVNGVDENLYFKYRMNAAATLYHQGKVKHLLVSGDNSNHHYNEPLDMKKALQKRGVPDSCITMDFAGLRTFDSIVRSQKVFQQKNMILVSQQFHNYRALFIAQKMGLQAKAFCAQTPAHMTTKMHLRECLARTKAVFDVYLLGTQPRFLGAVVNIRV